MGRSGKGFFGVHLTNPGKSKPYLARVKRGGKLVSLGSFATAEEAALCVARSPEGQAAAPRSAAAPPLTSEDALPQARDAIVREAALDIIHEAAGAATAELSAEVAVEAAAAPKPLTRKEARQQAQAEGPTLLRAAESKTAGYFGVTHRSGKPKP